MGQDINELRFDDEHFAEFKTRLEAETDLLERWLEDDLLDPCEEPTGGFELEAWLVGADQRPAPLIEPFLERVNSALVVPELATFNVELNGSPLPLCADALSRLAGELERTWQHCQQTAAGLDARLAMIGILPTVEPDMLDMAHMTPRPRYRALNEQVLRLRDGRPLELSILGEDQLSLKQPDVMLEAAATSFQIHLKVPARRMVEVYNHSKILSAASVGLAANAPFLFGHELWCESRIPLFEQAVSVGGGALSERVSFGVRYLERSVIEAFRANITRHPVLLPQLMGEPPEHLAHLRLHNGTIWRWNRPLIGLEPGQMPHLRIEHRVVPAGPTVSDCIANAAFYFGAVESLVSDDIPAQERMSFAQARSNFYRAARDGLSAEMPWFDGGEKPLRNIILDDLLPRAHQGLGRLGLERSEIDHWLGIIRERVKRSRTGAAWQRAWVARNGSDMAALTAAYIEHQENGKPVHEWALEPC